MQVEDTRSSAVQYDSCGLGGENVVRVAVQFLAGPVVTHRGGRAGVTGGDRVLVKGDQRSCAGPPDWAK